MPNLAYFKERWSSFAGQMHFLAHFFGTGIATAFFTRWTAFGFAVALVLPVGIEIWQGWRASRQGEKQDYLDHVLDLAEHALGGLVVGAAFWLTS